MTKIGPCLICQASTQSLLCQACFNRSERIYALEPIAVFCPARGCGFSPLETTEFARMYPDQAAKQSNGNNRILVIYSAAGCHRCMKRGQAVKALIYELKPPAS